RRASRVPSPDRRRRHRLPLLRAATRRECARRFPRTSATVRRRAARQAAHSRSAATIATPEARNAPRCLARHYVSLPRGREVLDFSPMASVALVGAAPLTRKDPLHHTSSMLKPLVLMLAASL